MNSDAVDSNPQQFSAKSISSYFHSWTLKVPPNCCGGKRGKLIFPCLAAFRVTFVRVVSFCILHLLFFAERWLLPMQSLQWKQMSATPRAAGLHQLVKQTLCRYQWPRVKEPLALFLSRNCASYCFSTGVFVDL